MSDVIIELKNICKIYQTETIETHALNNINLKIYAGDYVSLSGPSGCGKSTLLSIMGLLDEFNSGLYSINGQDVSGFNHDQAAEIRCQYIGFVFQSFNLIDELSVFENVSLPLTYHPQKMTRAEVKHKIDSVLSQVGLSGRTQHFPNQLSGGQQQRVAIARALVTEPSILLVDEPTGNLDTQTSIQIMNLLQALNEAGTTICLVTHEQQYAQMALTQLQLLDGKIDGH
ncbi:ABC transporter ATP-binding protein [Marinicella rhabdoformis]|uniref:ABC transporter ATP-binding protein n=1 Tax=Marinicella rhabdoformis TaxID=2580566 RepID=UPI0012AEC68B|nr:ABC transporter ATP-binding protein [Marinicella rhabdoformis]